MDLMLVRKQFRADGIFSELKNASDGSTFAVSLEHAYGDEESGYRPKIPSGLFRCVRGTHRLHGMTEDFETFEITGVEGHSNLLFHWGNFNKDSEGCVLLGESISEVAGDWMIKKSRDTFARFMRFQDGIDEFQLTVT